MLDLKNEGKEVGDVVLIKVHGKNRGKWVICNVEELHKGRDRSKAEDTEDIYRSFLQ